MRTIIVVLAAVASLAAPQAQVAEWFQWRGPNRDGHSPETGLLKEWPPKGPPLVWRGTGTGTGFSSFSASNGRLYTLGARGDTEYVIALDAATGKKLWETPNGRRFRNEMGVGPAGKQVQIEDPDGNPIELFEPAR